MSGVENLIIVRGGGDLATGTIYKLHQCGFSVLVLETENPSAIRRNVAFSEAVYQGTQTVEGLSCTLASSVSEAEVLLKAGKLTMLVDPAGGSIGCFCPLAVVDAILAKKNLGTCRNMAPITVALGPGFTAGVDVDAVVETKRGHNLGRGCRRHRLRLLLHRRLRLRSPPLSRTCRTMPHIKKSFSYLYINH